METLTAKILHIRHVARNLAEIPEIAEAGWDPANDQDFWCLLDEIEAAGLNRDSSQAGWLADFTQIDDLGPMGRALFLSRAALAALREMPETALEAGKAILASFPPDASPYRKIGLCLVFEATGSCEAIPLIQSFVDENDDKRKEDIISILDRVNTSA